MNTPHLETDRLVLRVLDPRDAAVVAAYCERNRAHLAPWEPLRPEEYFTTAHWVRGLELGVTLFGSNLLVPFGVFPRATPVGPLLGRCTFSNIVRGPFQAAYLGFSLDRDAVGQGLMTEALRAAIRYAFDDLGLHRIMANHMPENTRSARLLRGLGFVEEGYAKDYLRIAGAWRDHVLTALVNPSWTSR